MLSSSAEWLPVSMAPDGDLEVCVLDYDGIVHRLMTPCHREGAAWVDSSSNRPIGFQPTHWRKWLEPAKSET
jgi:hypothetical protein